MTRRKQIAELQAWMVARALTKAVYEVTERSVFNRDQEFKRQLRRAALSIPTNIAEGFERDSNKEFLYFLSIAKGSAGEVRSLIHTAYDTHFIEGHVYNDLLDQSKSVLNLIGGFMRYLKSSSMKGARRKN